MIKSAIAILATFIVVSLLWVTLGIAIAILRMPSVEPAPPAVGCLQYNPIINVTTNSPVIIDVKATFDGCPLVVAENDLTDVLYGGQPLPTFSGDAPPAPGRWNAPVDSLAVGTDSGLTFTEAETIEEYLSRIGGSIQVDGDNIPAAVATIVVGGIARAELKSPLSRALIEPIGDVDQQVSTILQEATWSWQVRADEPGDYDLALVVLIYDEASQQLIARNDRQNIVLRVSGTPSYYIGAGWSGVSGFLTSFGAVVVGIAAAMTILYQWYRKIRSRRDTKVDPDESRGGYL